MASPEAPIDWPTCLNAPNRACLLDEAQMRALLVGPAASREVGEIAELQATAGNLELAQRIAKSIPPEQRTRVIALGSIIRAGRIGDRSSKASCHGPHHAINPGTIRTRLRFARHDLPMRSA